METGNASAMQWSKCEIVYMKIIMKLFDRISALSMLSEMNEQWPLIFLLHVIIYS